MSFMPPYTLYKKLYTYTQKCIYVIRTLQWSTKVVLTTIHATVLCPGVS